MADRKHTYKTHVVWTGNLGRGTADYRAYTRDHVLRGEGRPDLAMSSDPNFRGNAGRHNPEELLVAALSSCHMLWYLHLCADAGIVVTAYEDAAEGVLIEDRASGGRFGSVILHPRVALTSASDEALAQRIHDEAHRKCFIANSVNFPVACEPRIVASTSAGTA